MENNEYSKGAIHKLFVGESKKPFFEVGTYNEVIDATIVEIIKDMNFEIETGVTKFLIVVQNKSDKVKWIWADPQGFVFFPQYAKPKNGETQNLR